MELAMTPPPWETSTIVIAMVLQFLLCVLVGGAAGWARYHIVLERFTSHRNTTANSDI